MFRRVRPQWPRPDNVRAFATTRVGGAGSGPWASFNLGRGCGDDDAVVEENRARFQVALPGPPGWMHQVHGVDVARREDFSAANPPRADAVVAFTPGWCCTVMTADCLPVLFCDVDGTRVGAAHAGWRGLAGGVLEATVAALDASPDTLLAWLGPAIGADAFEVGDDVLEAFTAPGQPGGDRAGQRFRPAPADPDGRRKWWCDLYGLARDRLAAAGVERVFGGGYCTYTERDRFFSYRRDGVTGRMATTIWLTSPN
ncbi:peptidoglycan editing factor PgeF [Marinihelvus fidelis]|uniref:Purine nucleoside phosphorylase n=1 Tax=Marinihelvus fidelis TaxID=2613842 RepID=A0A5N0T7U0_9GAMM|nr:peptidoglycan editing factor PgeF [Marinihelvus fidelis]KAA9129886.1 peptidoglycan editing factor PgeF [Marinihelvus fidelis]